MNYYIQNFNFTLVHKSTDTV